MIPEHLVHPDYINILRLILKYSRRESPSIIAKLHCKHHAHYILMGKYLRLDHRLNLCHQHICIQPLKFA